MVLDDIYFIFIVYIFNEKGHGSFILYRFIYLNYTFKSFLVNASSYLS